MDGLTKTFVREDGTTVPAVDDVSLEVSAGEFLILLGPSGCGKTTLLRLIAGLEVPDSGRVSMGGATVYDAATGTSVQPERRSASMVFQSYALWPHMSVYNNVAYPLVSRGVDKWLIPPRVTEVLELVGIGALRDQYPSQLSGGQQQRVALARAVVGEQDVILFDEPLSNVDAKVRDQLRVEILSMQRKLGFTALYVTHDQEEAMMLGERIAVLKDGKIEQIAPPREIYDRPTSEYVASFVGTVDEFPGRVRGRDGSDLVIETVGGHLWRVTTSEELSGEVAVMVRPERLTLHTTDPGSANCIEGVLESSMFMTGSRTEYLVRTVDGIVRVWKPFAAEVPEGTRVWLQCDPENLFVFGRGQ